MHYLLILVLNQRCHEVYYNYIQSLYTPTTVGVIYYIYMHVLQQPTLLPWAMLLRLRDSVC